MRRKTQDAGCKKYDMRNNKGGTILLLTVLILTSVLGVVLTSSEIVRIGVILGRTQIDATKAYFAAEAGAEKVLYETWSLSSMLDPMSCNDNTCMLFNPNASCENQNPCTIDTWYLFSSNNAQYQIEKRIDVISGDVILRCKGKYKDVNRIIELQYGP